MTGHLLRQPAIVVCLLCICTVAKAEDNSAGSFRDVLDLAGVGPEQLNTFSDVPDYSEKDWQLLIQLLHRLGQYSRADQEKWVRTWSEQSVPNAGDLFDVAGTVEEVQSIALPPELVELHGFQAIFRSHFRFSSTESDDVTPTGVVFSPQVPKRWLENKATEEPIKFRGILVQNLGSEGGASMVFVTEHLAWYPDQGVTTGQLLLARKGMDVALLDEIVQRQPFVSPEVSREGEAFYACLAALASTDVQELDQLAKRQVTKYAEQWQRSLKRNGAVHATEGDGDVLETNRRQQAMAAAVKEKSEFGLSSVAPLFIQPEQEVGELVRIEGIARRAVRIAATDQPEIEAYYELEIFTSDSQNLPVVCCVNRLPVGFPTGDEIRESVRVAGIFFKNWRYRTRQNAQGEGQTNRQQALYTPLIISQSPMWLKYSASDGSHWGLWGGIGFLIALGTVWIWLALLARRDQQVQTALRPVRIDLRAEEMGVESTE